MKTTFFRIVSVLICGLLPVEAHPQAEKPKEGGTLRVGIFRDISILNPYVGTRSVEHSVRQLIFEPLLKEENGTAKPYIAESWEVSKDGKVYTFRLRKAVRFHNGKEMNAEDVKWSIEYALDARNGAYGRRDLSFVQTAEVVEPYRIRVTLQDAFAPFLIVLTSLQSFPVMPKGMLSTAERPQVFPPGTGPFQFVEWRPAQQIHLKKFPGYWQKGLPRTDEIVLRPILDDDVRLMALRSGDLDIAERIPAQTVARIQSEQMGKLSVHLARGGGVRALVFNVKTPPFDNVKLRQAIAFAIDKLEILKGAHWGIGTIVNQKQLPDSPWYFPIPERKRDLERVKKLLAEAGYPNGLKIHADSSKLGLGEFQVIKSQLKEVGIEMEFEIMDSPTWIARMDAGKYGFGTTGGDFSADPDPTYYSDFRSEVGTKKGTVRNHTRYSHPKVDQLLDEARFEIDPKKRHGLYRQAMEIIHEEVPAIYLAIIPHIFGLQEHVKGLTTDSQGRYFTGSEGLPFAWIDKKS
jgi:peptide/nickel transport system substrate-binding protein